jgi:hypothetical protein
MDRIASTLLCRLSDRADSAIGFALADRLEEIEHPFAKEVRRLAEASPTIPETAPQWLQIEPGERGTYSLTRVAEWGPGTIPERFPVACGCWWTVEAMPRSVDLRLYRGASLDGVVFGDGTPTSYESSLAVAWSDLPVGHYRGSLAWWATSFAGMVRERFEMHRRALIRAVLKRDDDE